MSSWQKCDAANSASTEAEASRTPRVATSGFSPTCERTAAFIARAFCASARRSWAPSPMPVSKVLVATIMLITLNKQRPSNTFIWTVNFMMDLNFLSRRAARCARVSLGPPRSSGRAFSSVGLPKYNFTITQLRRALPPETTHLRCVSANRRSSSAVAVRVLWRLSRASKYRPSGCRGPLFQRRRRPDRWRQPFSVRPSCHVSQRTSSCAPQFALRQLGFSNCLRARKRHPSS